MEISIIESLVKKYSVEELLNAEETLLIEQKLPFELPVQNDAEVFDIITAAIWIIEKMESHELTFDQAFQEFRNK